ncbi:MmgE/PrpD family protein [Polaromonas hydrogenivorans]|uniref:MmgE/PrpD family protein n=1 Tax=Polaromonas hydrogenivorans TaxID=335476 RepID=A0AAU7LYI9_9BURK
MDKTIQKLARYVLETDVSRLSPQAVHESKRRLIDSVACAAAAYPEPFCAGIRAFAERYSGTPSARIWGSGARTSIEMAAFTNGTMLRYLDYSDTYLGKTAGHPSDMIGALVAVAEAHRLAGSALIESIVVAYEVYCGLCDSVALQSHGLDQATCAVVGTAAGVAKLLKLSQEQTANALSLALASNLHLYNVRCGNLSDWKGCAGPNGSKNGVFAALLANEDISGPTGPVDAKGGLNEIVGPFEWQVGAGPDSLIVGTHLKFHPVCYHGQSAIEAVLKLRESVALDDIADIHVETYEAAFRVMGSDPQRWAPSTRETADHSLPYTIAVALLDGRLTSDAYGDDRLQDPRIKVLMDKIRVSSSPDLTQAFPASAQTHITFHSRDGRVLQHLQQNPKGHAKNPLSDAELEGKFIELYAPLGGPETARQALDILWSVDKLADSADLVDAICLSVRP